MRCTLSACRSMSTTPMNTEHSRPRAAAAVAAATPCWPAPVSAITLGFPIRRASRAWPMALLILWAPVWARSSRFRRMWTPRSADRRAGGLQRRRPPDEVGQPSLELGAKGRDRSRQTRTLPPIRREPASRFRGQSARRSHQSDRPRPAGPGVWGSRLLRLPDKSRHEVVVLDRLAWISRRLEASTPQGRASRIASPTLSGPRPPARTNRRSVAGRRR